MDTTAILFSILFYFLIWSSIYILTSNFRSSRRRKTSFRLPPGPYQLPIIGNLHQISKKPHESFAKLAKTYGPIMSLRLGSRETVVVSSAAMAKEVLQTNDRVCSDRTVPVATHSCDHDKFAMGWLQPTHKWRILRRICKEQIFANHRLDASQGLRQEKLKELRDFVYSYSSGAGKTVDIGEAAFITSLNLVSTSLFSADFASYDSNSSQELKEAVWGVMKYSGVPNLSDYFPFLERFDPQGIARAIKFCYQKLLDIFDSIINERLQAREATEAGSLLKKKHDLLEAFLDHNLKNESEFSIMDLKHLLLDLFVAAIDTTSSTVEWAMTELMRYPEKMEKARDELNQVIGDEGVIQESDISRLPYLQAVVKETFRLHPAGPLLVPHKASEDVEINGYLVPKDTQILVNVWASGRDEGTWTEPEKFFPERFWESEIDVKGKHFELIPFGAGRRICPGLPLGYRMVHLMLASFIHNLHWKLESGIEPKDLDVEEKFGLSLQKAVPLRAIPVKL